MRRLILNLSLLIVVPLYFFACSSGVKEFRFALISDTHITQNERAIDDLRRAVEQINNTEGLDFVLVTGDLTDKGDRESLQKTKDLLDELNIKFYIVPGNHETKWSESGSTDFGHIFGYERFKFEHNGYIFLGFNTGPIIRMMDGHVAPQDITWLEEEFSAAKKGTPFILVTHYPLQDGDVDNWYEVTDLARKYNVKAVLGGHYHSNRLLSYDGIPGILHRSSLRDKADGVGGYSILEMTSDSLLVYEQMIGQEPRQWGGYALNEKYYDIDNSGYMRPSDSVNVNYSDVSRVWLNEIGNTILSAPVLYNDMVYVTDDAGVVSCLSLKDGSLIWEYKTDNRIVGTAAVDKGVVVLGSADNYIYALNADDGELIWKFAAEEPVLGSVTIDNEVAYVGASDGCMRAFNIHSGDLIWEFDGVEGYIETKPLVYQDKVVFGAWDNYMYALDSSDGTLVWKWNDGRAGMLYSPAAVWPVGAHGKVFFTAPDRVMTAADINTGKTVWRTAQSTVRETIGLSEDQTKVYSKTMQDSVVCYSALGNRPVRLWAVDVQYGYDHAPSMPVEKDGVLFGSTKNGLIFALDASDGDVMWKHKVGNSIINTVVPLDNSSCLFTSGDGVVGLISTKE